MKLEGLGYRAVAFGFFEDDVQMVHTEDCARCFTPKIVEYIRAVITSGKDNKFLTNILMVLYFV